MRFCDLVGRFDPTECLSQINGNAELWDQHTLRTTYDGTPFGGTSDIWLRFGDDPKTWGGPHFPVFYPSWDRLPALQTVVFDCMAKHRACLLGGVLLTRIPAGCEVLPHCDKGSWHADFYTTKVYAIIESNEDCINRFEDESVVMRPGEMWLFNNLVTHSVENHGKTDRIAMIICMRQS